VPWNSGFSKYTVNATVIPEYSYRIKKADEITTEVCYTNITSWEGCRGKGNKHKKRSSHGSTDVRRG